MVLLVDDDNFSPFKNSSQWRFNMCNLLMSRLSVYTVSFSWGSIFYRRLSITKIIWTLETAARNSDLVLRLNHGRRLLCHEVRLISGGRFPWSFRCMFSWSKLSLPSCICVQGTVTCVFDSVFKSSLFCSKLSHRILYISMIFSKLFCTLYI